MSLNILIVGAGVAGPALACFLQRSNSRYNITVIERASALRLAGQQVDVKAQGVPLLQKLGLLETMKAHCVAEKGLEIVDERGKRAAFMGINDPSKGQIGLTSEYEIMRGDIVEILHDASLELRAKLDEDVVGDGSLKYEFEKTITELAQDKDGVDITFSDGKTGRYDLVVGADGQWSRTRRLAFSQEVSDESFKSIKVHACYYSIPRVEGEGEIAKGYFAKGKRLVITRTGDRTMTGVYLWVLRDDQRLSEPYKKPIKEQKKVWIDLFQDAGWDCERLVRGMESCDDFYAHELGQVKMERLHTGRVVLLGDAGYCPTPFTGMGTTASLIGAYVIAGELAKNGRDVAAALVGHEIAMRGPIDECQKLPVEQLGLFFPSSHLGVMVVRKLFWALSTLKIDQLLHKLFPHDKKGWDIPNYPELEIVE
ncbi:hypothetical protein F5Y15DRAFT_111753 [Xylariaceae sp. FL0016]|nr:hypothetical protein F5Y15DRAFT_111753 [Xylariaceae sp. FL0016]